MNSFFFCFPILSYISFTVWCSFSSVLSWYFLFFILFFDFPFWLFLKSRFSLLFRYFRLLSVSSFFSLHYNHFYNFFFLNIPFPPLIVFLLPINSFFCFAIVSYISFYVFLLYFDAFFSSGLSCHFLILFFFPVFHVHSLSLVLHFTFSFLSLFSTNYYICLWWS